MPSVVVSIKSVQNTKFSHIKVKVRFSLVSEEVLSQEDNAPIKNKITVKPVLKATSE